ncbi:hypothetical protein BB561_003251 [Smittium simulii]|uniref:Hexosyltransferase n=1 Tax=Smittium simulii TaxID=133385 RepID=A0A2T9YME0_9FUNG|nr:hypothetical protein BB561_003251 [Smittium simulii]
MNSQSQQSAVPPVAPVEKKNTTPSYKMSVKELKYHEEIDNDNRLEKGRVIRLPNLPTGKIIDLYDEYLIMVPMSKYEDIDFFKNFYSDLNTLIICDIDDKREGCDVNMESTYNYNTLREKTHDIFSKYCKFGKTHKFLAKMDFDAIINKQYLYKVVKFMADNSDKRMYFGNAFFESTGIAMGGNFYALTERLVLDYCSCDTPLDHNNAEDLWFGRTINTCVKSKNLTDDEQIYFIRNDGSKIIHKDYVTNGVKLKLGKEVAKIN